jgi:uncharacterized protein (DUF1684 family)
MIDLVNTHDESAFRAWREARTARLLGPQGALALTGTHWFDDELALDAAPGTWRAVDSTSPRRATLTARAADAVLVDGEVLDGTATIRSDLADQPTAVTAGHLQLVLIDREGVLAVRVFDPESPARQRFLGISAFPWSASHVRPARFEPYPAEQVVMVDNADGVRRGLPLGGTVTFDLDGTTVRLAVERDADDGTLQAVFRDGTSGVTSYRFRFLDFPAPDAEGRTVADLNRAFLPPCAFSDHFVCPFPPPGNTLELAVEAGERAVQWADSASTRP